MRRSKSETKKKSSRGLDRRVSAVESVSKNQVAINDLGPVGQKTVSAVEGVLHCSTPKMNPRDDGI